MQIYYYDVGGTYLSMSEVNYSGRTLDTIPIDGTLITNNMGQYGTINNVVLIQLKLTNNTYDYDTQWFLLSSSGGLG